MPWMQFHTRDWLDNKELRRCSVSARAVLADLMCLAHEGEPYGYLCDKFGPLSDEFMSARCFVDVAEFRHAVIELVRFERVSEQDGKYFIKRMVEDYELRETRAAGGSKSRGNPKLSTLYNSPGFLYLMQRSSDRGVKIGIAINPQNRLYKLRSANRDESIELLHSFPVEDMGSEEARLHEELKAKKIEGDWFALEEEDVLLLKSSFESTFKGRPQSQGVPLSDSDSVSESSVSLVKIKTSKDKESDEWFEGEFWVAWPVRDAKKPGKMAARNIKPEEREAVIAGIVRQAARIKSQERPIHPATWINQRRWEDESVTAIAPRHQALVQYESNTDRAIKRAYELHEQGLL